MVTRTAGDRECVPYVRDIESLCGASWDSD